MKEKIIDKLTEYADSICEEFNELEAQAVIFAMISIKNTKSTV